MRQRNPQISRPITIGLALLLLLVVACPAVATVDFSAQTGLSCVYCHENPDGGGTLTAEGDAFRAAGFTLLKEHAPPLLPRLGVLIVGFLHYLAGFIWLGAIFYVHLFMGPRSLTSGLPKGEVMLGRVSILVVAATGVTLAVWRIQSWAELWTTTFGIVFMVKVGLFVLMVVIAAVTTTRIDRMLRSGGQSGPRIPDGSEGGPAHIVYEGQIYDVSQSRMWKNGVHMGRHRAGADLTGVLSGAPHGADVLERITLLGPAPESGQQTASRAMRLFVVLAHGALICGVLILICLAYWRWGPPLVGGAMKWPPEKSVACLECHREETPGIHRDWAGSLHARARVSCLHCHQAAEDDPDVSLAHFKQYQRPDRKFGSPEYMVPVSAVVTPRDCARCHPDEAAQYSRSKHADTVAIMWKIDPWLNQGLNSEVERASGCYACHGTVVRFVGGRPDKLTWPNVGVGRVNPDGSKGGCSSCHTRHAFSTAEARRPEACGQCHLGPDHPQIEIYLESKHGALYEASGREWDFSAAAGEWAAGRDYRAPTCAVCHMSGNRAVSASHNVSERLSWELQAPSTIRPSDFKPFPAGASWPGERDKMKAVCRECHGEVWVDDHYAKLDQVVAEYNEVYYQPALKMMDRLYEEKLLDRSRMFDERLEVEFYELWHHEGRRARMGAAMMAPDYAWWHGFYELKSRYTRLMEAAGRLQETGLPAYRTADYPNDTGNVGSPCR